MSDKVVLKKGQVWRYHERNRSETVTVQTVKVRGFVDANDEFWLGPNDGDREDWTLVKDVEEEFKVGDTWNRTKVFDYKPRATITVETIEDNHITLLYQYNGVQKDVRVTQTLGEIRTLIQSEGWVRSTPVAVKPPEVKKEPTYSVMIEGRQKDFKTEKERDFFVQGFNAWEKRQTGVSVLQNSNIPQLIDRRLKRDDDID